MEKYLIYGLTSGRSVTVESIYFPLDVLIAPLINREYLLHRHPFHYAGYRGREIHRIAG